MNNSAPGRNRADSLPKSSEDFSTRPVPVLQEILLAVAAATRVVTQLTTRFGCGDSAEELREVLAGQLAKIGTYVNSIGGKAPEQFQRALGQLIAKVQEATSSGESWLSQAGMQLEPLANRQRISRAYRIGVGAPSSAKPVKVITADSSDPPDRVVRLLTPSSGP